MHSNLIFRNSKIAQTQGFFEDTAEQDRPMRDVRDCAIKTPKYVEKMTLQLRDHANCREPEKPAECLGKFCLKQSIESVIRDNSKICVW